MKWPFRRKKEYTELSYQFLCKSCDLFYYEDSPYRTKCPYCGRKAEIYDVYGSKDGRE